ncbi:MAG TPA: ribosome small subunit-dependent GTPase A, partial [Desulfotomaculum sp.]|nr:ribosome small subunit-dependent GTPase A [Desulfotomaculum sp.]HCJ78880.1 ribosome small subunit-dependent GTPase A [Desulfotomaculum sp.]
AEPGCAVQEAVVEGKINPSRYHNYLLLLKEMNKRKRY